MAFTMETNAQGSSIRPDGGLKKQRCGGARSGKTEAIRLFIRACLRYPGFHCSFLFFSPGFVRIRMYALANRQ